MGIPGDLSSQSRFVKVAFTKLNSISGEEEDESVSQFFHILGSVDQQRGCCEVTEGKYEITIYTSCCNTAKVFIIIRLMIIIRSQRLTCMRKIWIQIS